MRSFLHRRHFATSSLIWSQKSDDGFEAIPCSAWQCRGRCLARCRLAPGESCPYLVRSSLLSRTLRDFRYLSPVKENASRSSPYLKPILFNCPSADHLVGSARWTWTHSFYETRLVQLHKLSTSKLHLQFFHSSSTSSNHPLSLICDRRKKNISWLGENRLFLWRCFLS